MKEMVQYQIFIGYNDPETRDQFVMEEELTKVVSSFFEKQQIDFSIVHGEGGFLYEDGDYIIERTMIITLIGEQNLDIMKLSEALSMFMNQECLMITRTYHDVEYR